MHFEILIVEMVTHMQDPGKFLRGQGQTYIIFQDSALKSMPIFVD